jgi:hypothetical protein
MREQYLWMKCRKKIRERERIKKEKKCRTTNVLEVDTMDSPSIVKFVTRMKLKRGQQLGQRRRYSAARQEIATDHNGRTAPKYERTNSNSNIRETFLFFTLSSYHVKLL